jgi:hypothetical protein
MLVQLRYLYFAFNRQVRTDECFPQNIISSFRIVAMLVLFIAQTTRHTYKLHNTKFQFYINRVEMEKYFARSPYCGFLF